MEQDPVTKKGGGLRSPIDSFLADDPVTCADYPVVWYETMWRHYSWMRRKQLLKRPICWLKGHTTEGSMCVVSIDKIKTTFATICTRCGGLYDQTSVYADTTTRR